MSSLKTTGGMTRGRGMTAELQRSVWLLSTPACAEINRSMQEVTGVKYEASDQHKETTQARLAKDFKDSVNIMKYIFARNPFDNQKELMSIDIGEVAIPAVNLDTEHATGMNILTSMTGKTVTDYTFKKKDTVVTMKARSTVQIDDEIIPVDPLLLFQRLITTVRGLGSDLDLETAFTYELCTFPPALVDMDGLLRGANKPQIADSIWSSIGPDVSLQLSSDVKYVLDGGSLLHKVLWTKRKTFNEIFNLHVDYVIKNYREGTTIVFDGYDGNPSTKEVTHIRRTKGKQGISVRFTGEMKLNMKKEDFLTNLNNKQRFLEMLAIRMNENHLQCIQSVGYADLLIVKTAILLILLLYHAKNSGRQIFFTSEQRNRTKAKTKLWDIKHTKSKLGSTVCRAVLVLHVCDTTFRLFSIGKGVAL